MDCARFYCECITEPVTELAGTEGRHLVSVLRGRAGERVELFDGNGGSAEAVIEAVSKGKVRLRVERFEVLEPRRSGRIVIAVSVAKGERFDRLIGKCTELGVERIVPVIFERTVKLAKNPRAVERWHLVAAAAAKQCRRVFLPRIDGPTRIADAIGRLRVDYRDAVCIVGSLSEGAVSILDVEYGGRDVIAFVGPEGGLTEAEEQLLAEKGCRGVRLTDTVLRIETAAEAIAAILATIRINR